MPRPPDPEEDDFLDDDALSWVERPSKTALKKQMHELQTLGEELASLPADRLADLDLPEPLRDALADLRRVRSHEGKRRQRQYVGKLIRSVDPEPLREAVAAFKLGSARDTLRLHEAERWRVDLVAGDDAVTRWANDFPDTDLQRLRTLVRNARKDAALPPEQRHGKAWRELFQFIKPHLSESAE